MKKSTKVILTEAAKAITWGLFSGIAAKAGHNNTSFASTGLAVLGLYSTVNAILNKDEIDEVADKLNTTPTVKSSEELQKENKETIMVDA